MVVKVSKPAINLREKLSELDFAKVPFQKMPAGSVVQMVSTESLSTVLGAVGVEPTVLSLNITPKQSTNKIVIFSTLTLICIDNRGYNYTDSGYARIIRDDVTEVTRASIGTSGAYDSQARDVVSMVVVDSPNTISSVNYKLTIRGGEALYDTCEARGTDTKNSLVVMEIST